MTETLTLALLVNTPFTKRNQLSTIWEQQNIPQECKHI